MYRSAVPTVRPVSRTKPALSTALGALAFVCSCTSGPQFPDASPVAVEECRREAALLAQADPGIRNGPMSSETAGGEVIEQARTAAAEARRPGLAGWPEEILIYRCLVSRGEPLTTRQASELADWQKKLEERGR